MMEFVIVVVIVASHPAELVQFLHRGPSKWFGELVLNWRIPPGRCVSFRSLDLWNILLARLIHSQRMRDHGTVGNTALKSRQYRCRLCMQKSVKSCNMFAVMSATLPCCLIVDCLSYNLVYDRNGIPTCTKVMIK